MSSFGFSANPNSGVSNETRNLTIKGRQTIPLGLISQTPVQRGGSLIFDPRTLKLFYSDGTQWLEVVASPGGNLVCIQDTDGDTSVCTDTIPETDSDTIFFNTAGTEKARISSTGVFMVGTTTPTPGKIAHFEGDIDVTGIVDPIGVQYTQQGSIPGSTNVPDKGMLYTDSASLGTFSNTLVFVDNTDTPHTLGDMIGTSGPVTDNAIVRFDGTTGKLLKDSSIILDTGVLSRPTGDIGLVPDSGDGFVTVTGSVNISKDLNVFGTTTTSQSQHLLIGDNCIYLNDGYLTPAALEGCIVVNYLPTANIASVAIGGFTAGNGGAPTVVTDNAFAWTAGDIIQISGASNAANDGLFEVDSYVNPLLTIRGVGGIGPTFNFFQNQFETDATVAGTITQVGVAVISSGSDGIWETNNAGNNTVGMTFADIGGSLATSGTGTFSLVFDAGTRTLKELTSGANITIVDSGTGNLTISTIGGATSPYEQSGEFITPVSASVNAIVAGSLNIIADTSDSCIAGGRSNTIDPDGNASLRNFIGGGFSHSITRVNNVNVSDNAIIGGSNHTFLNSECNAAVGGLNGTITGSNNIIGSVLIGGSGNTINACPFSCIVCGANNSIAPNGNGATGNFIAASSGHTMTRAGNFNVQFNAMLGGVGSSIVNANRCVVLGSNNACVHDGCFMFSDHAGGTDLGSGAIDRFSVRCNGGARFFTNTANTVGVSLTTSSWASVSDRDLKENIVECDYTDFLSKVENLPVYCYNFIGNPVEEICFGPMAQDWYTQFPVAKINVEEPSMEDQDDPPVIVEKDAKDIKSIEMMDMIGVCLSAIKALISKNNQLEARISALES